MAQCQSCIARTIVVKAAMGVQVLFKSDKGTVVKQLIKNNYKKPCFYKNTFILSGWWFCE
jgi:hypothetical protein